MNISAKWICSSEESPSPIFRKTFTIHNIRSATLTICGLGFFELYVNGQKADDSMFVPVWSNYVPRKNRRMLYPIHDKFDSRIYFMEYDIHRLLKSGENTIGIWLGNGWFCQDRRNVEGDFSYGTPMLHFSLSLISQNNERTKIVSDDSVKWIHSEIIDTNIYMGETHDLSKRVNGFSTNSFDDSGWKTARLTKTPESTFEIYRGPVDRCVRKLYPKLIHSSENRRIFDCGENLSGYVVVQLPTKAGSIVTITHSEELDSTRTKLDYNSTNDGDMEQIQTDRYICSDVTAICHPKFTWHGFRYFEIIGEAEVMHVSVVHADVQISSSFSCSDEVLNWLYDAYIRSQLTNMHCGVPSDCPHRERLGYTGDGQITAEAAMLTLDSRSFFEKWMKDIADCQDKKTGHVQHTAPFYGGGGGPGGWGAAIYVVPFTIYKLFGDKEILLKYYHNIRLWLAYMHSRTEKDLVTNEEQGGWCLGDWATPDEVLIPESFVNTYFYMQGMNTLFKSAPILSLNDDLSIFETRKHACEKAIIRDFFNTETGSFCNGVNGADAFAVALGLGDERTLRAIVSKYEKEKILDTGIFGTDILIDVLCKNGYGKLAVTLIRNSFEKTMKSGATTLWENWNGAGSHNHPMFGGMVRCLFTHILGIKQTDQSAGFVDYHISPSTTSLSWAKGHIITPNGKISVDWVKDEENETGYKFL